jgi:hypothetical protein
MKRRDLLQLAVTLPAAIQVLWPRQVFGTTVKEVSGVTSTSGPLHMNLDDQSYFLSTHNPLATADQLDAERLALSIFEGDDILQARELASQKIRTLVGKDGNTEGWQAFDSFLNEWVYSYILKAINSDPNYPRIVEIFTLAHQWFGHSVPGSRGGGGPGPDQAYLLIPIDHGGQFELVGRPSTPSTSYCVYSLMGNASLTMPLADLEGDTLTYEPDGSYRITLDPRPANGRPNHIQTRPGTRYLFIRDCRNDWRELPDRRRVVRLSPPTIPQWTKDQMTELASKLIVDDVVQMFWWVRLFENMTINTMTPPFGSSSVGGLSSQMISFGRVSLEKDEAFIITVSNADAKFRDIVLHDYWFNTISDYSSHTSSLTHAQGVPNPDGTTTYVLSLNDPGVYNWLNPTGLSTVLIAHRWQGLPAENGRSTSPTVSSHLVKLADLKTYLPREMKYVNSLERQEQIAQRKSEFALRFAE